MIADRIPSMTPGELRGALEALGMSSQAAADFLGVAAGTVAHWTTGERQVPGPAAVLIRLARRRPDLINEISASAHVQGSEAPPRQRGRPRRQSETPDSKKAAG